MIDKFNYYLDLINEIEVKLFSTEFYSQENIQKRITEHKDENGNLDIYSALNLVMEENRHFTALLLAHVLSELDTQEE